MNGRDLCILIFSIFNPLTFIKTYTVTRYSSPMLKTQIKIASFFFISTLKVTQRSLFHNKDKFGEGYIQIYNKNFKAWSKSGSAYMINLTWVTLLHIFNLVMIKTAQHSRPQVWSDTKIHIMFFRTEET
jgi:hypothetical protein